MWDNYQLNPKWILNEKLSKRYYQSKTQKQIKNKICLFRTCPNLNSMSKILSTNKARFSPKFSTIQSQANLEFNSFEFNFPLIWCSLSF